MHRWMMAAVLMLSACGGPGSKYCKAVVECEPSYDEDTCLDDYEESAEASDELGCGKEYDGLVKCSAKTIDCDDDLASLIECDQEVEAYFDCVLDGASFTSASSE